MPTRRASFGLVTLSAAVRVTRNVRSGSTCPARARLPPVRPATSVPGNPLVGLRMRKRDALVVAAARSKIRPAAMIAPTTVGLVLPEGCIAGYRAFARDLVEVTLSQGMAHRPGRRANTSRSRYIAVSTTSSQEPAQETKRPSKPFLKRL